MRKEETPKWGPIEKRTGSIVVQVGSNPACNRMGEASVKRCRGTASLNVHDNWPHPLFNWSHFGISSAKADVSWMRLQVGSTSDAFSAARGNSNTLPTIGHNKEPSQAEGQNCVNNDDDDVYYSKGRRSTRGSSEASCVDCCGAWRVMVARSRSHKTKPRERANVSAHTKQRERERERERA